MNDSDNDVSGGPDSSESSGLDEDQFADYFIDKPLSIRDYLKLLYYCSIAIVMGEIIVVLVFIVNK